MKYDPQKHRRQSMRLQNHDYTQPGAYFVTVCAQDRACLFGDVVDGEMRLNETGQIVQAVWNDLPRHYPTMQNDAFVVMPNHVHGVIMIVGAGFVGAGFVGAGFKPAPTHGLPEFVRAFKTFSSRRINELRQTAGVKIWQRNYYEHVVRDDASLDRIREYIINNPRQWALDRENPLNIREGAGAGSSTSAGFVGAGFVGAGLKPAPTGGIAPTGDIAPASDVAPTHGFRKGEP